MKDDSLYWAGSHVSIDDYDKKMIEIALPDVIISESIKKELDDFKINCAERGIEVIYKLILD